MTNDIKTRLSNAPVTYLSLTDVVADPDQLQKRRPDVLHEAQRHNTTDASEELIGQIAESLGANSEFNSTPVKAVRCVAEVDDEFGTDKPKERIYLVDGFHRYSGYMKAGRSELPVQVVDGTWNEAHYAATVYNNFTVTVPVNKEEKRQAAWELVVRYTNAGADGLKGVSGRSIARDLGVSPQTVANMVSRAKELGDAARRLTWAEARSDREDADVDDFILMVGLIKKTVNEAKTLSEETVKRKVMIFEAYLNDELELEDDAAVSALAKKLVNVVVDDDEDEDEDEEDF